MKQVVMTDRNKRDNEFVWTGYVIITLDNKFFLGKLFLMLQRTMKDSQV